MAETQLDQLSERRHKHQIGRNNIHVPVSKIVLDVRLDL